MSLTKSAFVTEVLKACEGNPSKASIEAVLKAVSSVCAQQLKAGEAVAIPGVVKLKAVTKAAQPERDGVNPFTKEKIRIPAKPASKKVRASAVKALKDAIA